MRDIAVTLIVFGALPYIMMRPHIGIYAWSWIGYMAPHRLGWGFATNLPFAALIGGVTLERTKAYSVDTNNGDPDIVFGMDDHYNTICYPPGRGSGKTVQSSQNTAGDFSYPDVV